MTKLVSETPDVATEQRILDAAHAVFLRSGTAGARMQEIADEAGVNKALLHYYFRSKDRLAEAVFQRAAMRLFPAVLRILASDLEIEEKVQRVVEHYLDHLSETPYLAGYVLCELNQHPDRITQYLRAVAAAAGDPSVSAGRHAADKPPRIQALDVLEKQLRARSRGGTMRPIAREQFLVNLLGLCIFPFAARPILEALLGMDAALFQRFIAHRRKELPAFFLRALEP
jgi:AcrR family transcriptional regulator